MPDYKMKIIVEAVSKNKDELTKAKEQLDGIDEGGSSASSGLNKMLDKWAGNILSMGTFVAAGKKVIDILKQSVVAAAESELAEAKRNAIYDTTNASTRTSIALLDQYASTLSNLNAVDDEVIVGAEEMALQFRSISGNMIPKLIQAAADLAGGFRGDVIGTTESLGRTLELVGQGSDGATMAISTLRRQNVILDESTQKLVISLAAEGKVTEAQTVLLNALADITGGRAAAAADTLAGKWEKTKNSAENLQEAIGKKLTPEIERQLPWINQSIQGWTNFITLTTKAQEIAKGRGESWTYMSNGIKMNYIDLARWELAARGEIQTHEDAKSAIDPEIQATLDLEESKRLLSAAMSGDLQNAYDTYEQNMQDLTTKSADLTKQLKDLRNSGYAETSPKIMEVKDAMHETAGAIEDQNALLSKNISLMIFNQAAAHLNAKGQLELAKQLGLSDTTSLEAAVAIEELSKKYDAQDGVIDGVITNVSDYNQELKELRGRLLGIPAEIESNVIVTTTYVGTFPTGTNNNQGHEAGSGPGQGGYADGGVISGPTSGYYVNAPFHGTEAVIPLKGGSVPVVIQGSELGGGGMNFAGATINILLQGDASMGEFYQAMKNGGGSL